MRRLRARLDRLESHAHQTMGGADELVALAKALIEDLQDGVTVELTIFGKAIPIQLRIDPREKETT